MKNKKLIIFVMGLNNRTYHFSTILKPRIEDGVFCGYHSDELSYSVNKKTGILKIDEHKKKKTTLFGHYTKVEIMERNIDADKTQ
jgi:hypothetical protein